MTSIKTKRYEVITTPAVNLMIDAMNEKDIRNSVQQDIISRLPGELRKHEYSNGFLMHSFNYKFALDSHHNVYVYGELELTREIVSTKTFKVLKKIYNVVGYTVSIFSYGDIVFTAEINKEDIIL